MKQHLTQTKHLNSVSLEYKQKCCYFEIILQRWLYIQVRLFRQI